MEDKKQGTKEKKNNIMRKVRLADVVLNCGATEEKLERSLKLLKIVSGRQPIKTISKKRIPSFSVRPGLEVGCKVTLRGKEARELIKRLLEAVNNQLKMKQICPGKVSFGIHEYIEIPGMQFQRDIGILGFDVNINLSRAGRGIIFRKIKRGSIPARHRISKEETIKFMEENFNTKII